LNILANARAKMPPIKKFGSPYLLFLCLVGGMLASAASRTDANWDIQNYHLYTAFTALSGRLGSDYLTAGFQGYLNPLLDIPYYLAKFVIFPGHPLVVAALAGLPFGTLVYIDIRIAQLLLPPASPRWEPLIIAAMGVTGATTLSEVGTTYGDIPVSTVVLFATFLALKSWASPDLVGMILGLGLGAAIGLKFTTVIFVPGGLAMTLLAANQLGQATKAAILFGGASLLGFMVTWGWWGFELWRHYDNPVYPLLGQMFPSAWSISMSSADGRFFPRSTLQWLAYPLFWIEGKSCVVSEEAVRDPRFLLAYVGLLCLLPLRFFKSSNRFADRKIVAIWIFFGLSYLCWLRAFSILRYAMPLEALSGIVFWTALRASIDLKRPLLWAIAALVACVLITKPIGWGRVGYSHDLVRKPLPSLPRNALIFVAGYPIGFVVPYLNPSDQQFVRIDSAPFPPAEATRVVTSLSADVPLRLLTNISISSRGWPDVAARLRSLGLAVEPDACRAISSPIQATMALCEVRKASSARTSAR
jgi:hypothetical protein